MNTGVLRAVLFLLAVLLGGPLLNWALVQAVFLPNAAVCAQASGACWGVVAEKWRILLLGRMPVEHTMQALCATALLTLLLWLWARGRFSANVRLGFSTALALVVWLLLTDVPSTLWGGLTLTLLLSMGAMAVALPLGVGLALGRRYGGPVLGGASATFIESGRALPLVSVLFLAAYALPLMLPAGWLSGREGLLPRVILTVGVFMAAYLAEVVRGGLQTIPAGQLQAAMALGFGRMQALRLVVVPQALKACSPALVNSFVTLFKECALVSVVSLFELSGALSLALSGDVQWRAYYLEAAMFVAAIYWVYCYALGQWAQQSDQVGARGAGT